tara:strand:+ start:727 stop:942 length:216 start_codon:yes stop_codon:yes gene_type:complete
MSKDPLEKLKFMQQSAEHESRQQEIRVKKAIAAQFPAAAEDARRWQALGRTLGPIAYRDAGGEWITWEAGR